MAQVDIAEQAKISRPTVGRRLNQLRTMQLTNRPRGKNAGETITETGRAVLRCCYEMTRVRLEQKLPRLFT